MDSQAAAGKGTTVSFPIVPTAIGHMKVRVTARAPVAADAVERQLLVEVGILLPVILSLLLHVLQRQPCL